MQRGVSPALLPAVSNLDDVPSVDIEEASGGAAAAQQQVQPSPVRASSLKSGFEMDEKMVIATVGETNEIVTTHCSTRPSCTVGQSVVQCDD